MTELKDEPLIAPMLDGHCIPVFRYIPNCIKQEKLCTTCEFWADERPSGEWCYMFEEMPEYRCMAWEEENKR